MSAGLRNDVTDDVLAMRQRWRLCDIRLEEYNFVVLSRLINAVEKAVRHSRVVQAGCSYAKLQGVVVGFRRMAKWRWYVAQGWQPAVGGARSSIQLAVRKLTAKNKLITHTHFPNITYFYCRVALVC